LKTVLAKDNFPPVNWAGLKESDYKYFLGAGKIIYSVFKPGTHT
jgi:hypothetical protein